MYKVGDRVEAVEDFQYEGIRVRRGEIGTVVGVSNLSTRSLLDARFDSGTVSAWCPPYPYPEVRLLPEPEFDQGGLQRMPDGTLESVDIPGPEAEKTPIPYTATGTGGPPKPKPPETRFVMDKAFSDWEKVCIRLDYKNIHGGWDSGTRKYVKRGTWLKPGWFRWGEWVEKTQEKLISDIENKKAEMMESFLSEWEIEAAVQREPGLV